MGISLILRLDCLVRHDLKHLDTFGLSLLNRRLNTDQLSASLRLKQPRDFL